MTEQPLIKHAMYCIVQSFIFNGCFNIFDVLTVWTVSRLNKRPSLVARETKWRYTSSCLFLIGEFMQADKVVHDFWNSNHHFSILSSKFVHLNCSVLQSLCIVMCVCVCLCVLGCCLHLAWYVQPVVCYVQCIITVWFGMESVDTLWACFM